MQIGDKVTYGSDKTPATVTKLYKNGKARIEYWVQGGFMRQPELWKDTVNASQLEARP